MPLISAISALSLAPYPERIIIAKAASLLVLVRLGLLLFSFKTLMNSIEWIKSKSRTVVHTSRIDSYRIAWSVVVASRYIPFKKCLAQALVTQILFVCYGFTSQLRIGVAKDGKKRLKAHAWVESQGRIVVRDLMNLSQYSPFESLKREKSINSCLFSKRRNQ